MAKLTFSEAEQQALHQERYEHPHPRVQQRPEVLWLLSQGLVYAEAARLAGVSEATADRYVAAYRQGGLEALRRLNWGKSSTSELLGYRDSLAESFRRDPPHTVAEACQRIKDETGVERKPTQVRAFVKKLAVTDLWGGVLSGGTRPGKQRPTGCAASCRGSGGG
jgi:transposase